MSSDIEIAQNAKMEKIQKIAEKINISSNNLELYGDYKAKLSESLWASAKNNPDGKLVLITAINPTPAGEGTNTRRTAETGRNTAQSRRASVWFFPSNPCRPRPRHILCATGTCPWSTRAARRKPALRRAGIRRSPR